MLCFIKAAGVQDHFLKLCEVKSRGEEFKAEEIQGTPGGIRESNWENKTNQNQKETEKEWDGE